MTGAMIWQSTSVSSNEDVSVFLCNLSNMRTESHIYSAFVSTCIDKDSRKRTNSGANVSAEDSLDGQVRIDFANDKGGVAIGEVSFLFNVRITTILYWPIVPC